MIQFVSIAIVCLMLAGVGVSSVLASEDQDQITEITLERTMCFGTCPAYKVTLRQDETATYIGQAFVDRKGTYKGKIHKFYFDKLAKLLQSLDYFALKDNYSQSALDLPTVITTVLRGSKRKTIRNYGNVGPIKLWGIEMAIDAVVARIKWEKIPEVNKGSVLNRLLPKSLIEPSMIERFEAYLVPSKTKDWADSIESGKVFSERDKKYATYLYLGQKAEVAGDLSKAAEFYNKALGVQRYEMSSAGVYFDLARVAYKKSLLMASGDFPHEIIRVLDAKLEVLEYLVRFLRNIEQELLGYTPWGPTPDTAGELVKQRNDTLWILRKVAEEIEAIPRHSPVSATPPAMPPTWDDPVTRFITVC